MKIPHHEIPLFKPLMLFILGIVASEYLPVNFRVSAPLVYLILGLITFAIISHKINNANNSIAVIIIFFFLGFTNHQEQSIGYSTEKFTEEQVTFTVRIDKLLPHKKHKKCFVKVLSELNAKNDLTYSNGKLLIYFKDLGHDSSIVIGNEYLIQAKAFPIQKTNNPHAFNYAGYLKQVGIHHQVYLKEGQFNLIRKDQNTGLDRIVQSIRNTGLVVFQKYFPDQDKFGILHAMVLGKRDSLGKELNQSFIDTGAIHVLAVSGLHVGILCLLVTGLFKAFESVFRLSKIKRGIISVAIIWFFALITGASPAVCRAALMFTLFFIAKDVLHRKVSIYNVLAGTAFILLVINSSQLFQVGFQFSFLAVLSIVFFYPYINHIFISRFKLVNYFYSSISIGIAAQILVFPLGIFYFNKFANSFLITSMFVVQFAMIILIGGLAILIFEFLGLAIINRHFLVPCMDFILEKFQWLIAWVQSLPLSSSDNLWLDQIQLLLIYFCIISSMYYLKQRRVFIYIALMVFFGLINYTVHERIAKENQYLAYIYDAKDSCIDIYIGRTALHIGVVSKEEGAFVYARNRLAHSIDRVYPIEKKKAPQLFEYDQGLIRLGNQIIAFANIETFDSIKEDQSIDYILVGRENMDLEQLNIDRLKGVEIILDGSIKFWERENILSFAAANGLIIHDVKTEGAKKIVF